jgi:hypothetical protein
MSGSVPVVGLRLLNSESAGQLDQLLKPLNKCGNLTFFTCVGIAVGLHKQMQAYIQINMHLQSLVLQPAVFGLTT